MGKIGKPQKKKKNKIKRYGWHKNNHTLNKAPKNCEQEVPRRLRELGMAIREIQAGKKSRNKFQGPDGPSPNGHTAAVKGKKFELKASSLIPLISKEGGDKKKKVGKKVQKVTKEATEEYIDNLKPTRPLLENFKFKQKSRESDGEFLSRVERETQDALTRSKIADKFEVKEKDEIKTKVKAKLDKQRQQQKKQKLEEASPLPMVNEPEREPKDFSSLRDDTVVFGEVAHAPPSLSVLPKYAKSQGHDRPGRRMNDVKELFRGKGESIKRKHLSSHKQMESDANRENFVEAYRQMKKQRKFK